MSWNQEMKNNKIEELKRQELKALRDYNSVAEGIAVLQFKKDQLWKKIDDLRQKLKHEKERD